MNACFKQTVFACLLSVTALLVSACGQKTEEADESSQTNGVYEDSIILGSSSSLTGFVGFLGSEYVKGAQLVFDEVNRTHGIHGREIKLITLDDQYDPAKTVANTQQLIQKDKVFALFNYVGTPTSIAVKDIIREARIPTVGLLTGAASLRTADNHYIFHIRDSYYAEAEAAVHYYADLLGLKNFAVFYQEDAFGIDLLKGVQLALKNRGLAPVVTDTYKRGSTEIEDSLQFIYSKDVDVVMLEGTYSPLAKFIARSHQMGKHPHFSAVSFVGSEAYGNELLARKVIEKKYYRDIMVTQVVPSPHSLQYPTATEYYQLNVIYSDGAPATYVGFEGFINAKLLVHALEKAGRELTREKLLKQLEQIHDYDLGIGKNISYSGHDHSGIEGIYYSRMNEQGTFEIFQPR